MLLRNAYLGALRASNGAIHCLKVLGRRRLRDGYGSILLNDSMRLYVLLQCAEVDLSDRPRSNERKCAKGSRTHQQVPSTAIHGFFNRIGREFQLS